MPMMTMCTTGGVSAARLLAAGCRWNSATHQSNTSTHSFGRSSWQTIGDCGQFAFVSKVGHCVHPLARRRDCCVARRNSRTTCQVVSSRIQHTSHCRQQLHWQRTAGRYNYCRSMAFIQARRLVGGAVAGKKIIIIVQMLKNSSFVC